MNRSDKPGLTAMLDELSAYGPNYAHEQELPFPNGQVCALVEVARAAVEQVALGNAVPSLCESVVALARCAQPPTRPDAARPDRPLSGDRCMRCGKDRGQATAYCEDCEGS